MTSDPSLRSACPAGLCDCRREQLSAAPAADTRILRLTRAEEKRLIERLGNVHSLAQLQRLQQLMFEQLGIRMSIAPGLNEVKSMRGIAIHLAEQPGLCRKTRQAIPAAVRRGLEQHPEVAYGLLNAHDLLRDA